jgi:hypothetical protein
MENTYESLDKEINKELDLIENQLSRVPHKAMRKITRARNKKVGSLKSFYKGDDNSTGATSDIQRTGEPFVNNKAGRTKFY